MTSRFERLSLINQITLIALLAVIPALIMPDTASAQIDQNKQRLVVEIKNFQTITIPDISDMPDFINNNKNEDQVEEVAPAPVVKPAPYQIPSKVAVEDRVYMHEPEIRAYVCPKMGNGKCEIFIAVLKAENGTHECTRDNRGLNRNGSLDVGLAQINWNAKYNPPYTVEQLRDCKFNLDIALQKYQARGFQPWYAYTKGAYKKFLKPVTVN